MTERQQNRNICVVGKVKDGMTIDTSKNQNRGRVRKNYQY